MIDNSNCELGTDFFFHIGPILKCKKDININSFREAEENFKSKIVYFVL